MSELLAGIVLAAGRARRFGADKRLQPLPNGEPILARCIALVAPHCHRVLVSLRPEDDPQFLLGSWWHNPAVEACPAPDAHRGMGHSLANAVQRLRNLESRQCEYGALLVMLGDMPAIAPGTVAQLAAARDRETILRPSAPDAGGSQRPGHPVVFGRAWFPRLEGLRGDRGARDILAKHPEACRQLPVADGGIHRDVDRPADLQGL